jgi:hypothetical protein
MKKDSLYNFSTMLKLSKESSFGVKWIGVYFHQDFPEDFIDVLYDRQPDLVFSGENLTKNDSWQELSGLYKASGNEQFFSLGYAVNPQNGIIRNRGFQRMIQSTCGPQHRNGYCYNYEVTYKDSLFARYYVDNFVVVPANIDAVNAAIFNPAVINQTQIIFDFGGTKNNPNIDAVKKALVQTLDVMRVDDGIAITHIHKNTEHKLAPTNYENKRKIIRLIQQYRATIKPGHTVVSDFALLFETTFSPGHYNSVVIVTEGKANYQSVLTRLNEFVRNGNFLIIINTGADDSFLVLQELVKNWPNTKVLNSNDSALFPELLKSIWRK